GIEASRTRFVKKRKARRRSQHHAAAIERGVRHVVSKQAVSAAQYLLLAAQLVEQDQTVRSSNSNHTFGGVRQNPIDTENIVILVVRRVAPTGVQNVHAVIEKADP